MHPEWKEDCFSGTNKGIEPKTRRGFLKSDGNRLPIPDENKKGNSSMRQFEKKTIPTRQAQRKSRDVVVVWDLHSLSTYFIVDVNFLVLIR